MKKPTAILFITDQFQVIGGAERNLLYILRNINKNKYRPVLCCLRAGNLADALRREGFEIIDAKIKRVYSPFSFKKILYLLSLIKERNVKLIVTYHESSDFIGILLSKFASVPIVSSKRDMGYQLKTHHILTYKLIGRFYDGVIAVSDAVKKTAKRHHRMPDYKFHTIYNGVDLRRFQKKIDVNKKKEQIGITSDAPILGCVANFRKIKGIRYFIEAASIVLREIEDAQFVIVGSDPGELGYTRKDMEKVAKNLGIAQEVLFLGKRDDVSELLLIFDICVIPSLSEGFSNTILEAMAVGTPVVATNVGGNPEAVVNGKTGFLVPPEDAEALAEASVFLIKNKELANKIGQAGIERARELFSLSEMMEATEDFFDYIIQTQKVSSCRRRIFCNWLKQRRIFFTQAIKLVVSAPFYYSGAVRLYLSAREWLGKPIKRIIAFHNISDQRKPFLGLSVSPEIFDRVIRFIKKDYRIVPLEKITDHVAHPDGKRNAIALTLDDSYKEFYSVVWPILKKTDVPATIFLALTCLETGTPLPVDLLIFAMRNSRRYILDLTGFGLKRYLLDTDFAKEQASFEINEYLKLIDSKKQNRMIESIFAKVGITIDAGREACKVLTWSDVQKMSNDGVSFGSHTVTHPNLAAIPIDDAREEICNSKQLIENRIGSKVTWFSYPYGDKSSYNSNIIALVKSCGYENAVTLVGANSRTGDRFQMSRSCISAGVATGPAMKFSKSILAIELSGLSRYLFLGFLRDLL